MDYDDVNIQDGLSMAAEPQLNLSFIRDWAEPNGLFLTGRIDGLTLFTALQPIYSLAHKRVVGYEALVRVKDRQNSPLNPASLFDRDTPPADLIHLDRLCRYLHIHNFKILKDEINWLFLNVSPRTIISGKTYGAYFNELLEALDFPAHRVVIEVVEYPIGDNDLLMETIAYYKSLGCLIAIDDFGAGHSNFDRIWTLRPDIVKLDRSFLVKSSQDPAVRNLLPGIVTLLHQAGSLVLLEGIETRDQAMMAIESDADFVQGYYFGRPHTKLKSILPAFSDFPSLLTQYKKNSEQEEAHFKEGLQQYRSLFFFTIESLKSGEKLNSACESLLLEPEVLRCYRIGTDGIQIGNTLVAPLKETQTDKRFKPLEDASSADWFRRHYLKRAVYHPEQLQITRPYLSITGAHMCVTLSMKFSCPWGDSVLCCDLRADQTSLPYDQ